MTALMAAAPIPCAVFVACAVALVFGLLADKTSIGSGLAAAVRGTLPNEQEN